MYNPPGASISDAPLSGHRVYYPYNECEEFRGGGMWKPPPTHRRQEFIDATSALMADPERFYQAMLRALDEWPKSCETNLTAQGNNQRAWLGHAGCYLATGSTEETTRLGWHTLDDPEQYAANAAADRAISEWRRRRSNEDAQMTLDWEDPHA